MIHVVGDSHVSVFAGVPGLQPAWPVRVREGLPGVESVRLGPYLAHSLTRPGHGVRRKLRGALSGVGRRDVVLLSFGEIDCRCHVVPQAARQGVSIERVASELARAYVRAARALVREGTLAFLAASPPSAGLRAQGPWSPKGSLRERARAARAFNEALTVAAREAGCAVIDVTSDVTDERGRADRRCVPDGIHLGPGAVPHLAAALRRAGLLSAAGAARMAAAAKGVPVLFDRASRACAAMGASRVALFGAGRHTRRMGLAPFERRGVRVSVILDDQPRQKTMLGRPVRTPEMAEGFDAVVISSDTHEDALTRRARRAFGRRIPVVRIYDAA